MLRLILVFSIAFAFGGFLAIEPAFLPMRPGLTGLAVMTLAAVAVRHYWRGLTLGVPGSPERTVWLSFGSTALVAGHLFTSLWRIGPGMEFHSLATHALGIDNWTLVLGATIAYVIARDPEPRDDERDVQIANRGYRASHWTQLVQLLALILLLGFAPRRSMERVSQLMLAHLLIATLVNSTLAGYAAQLHAYWLDHRAELTAASEPDIASPATPPGSGEGAR